MFLKQDLNPIHAYLFLFTLIILETNGYKIPRQLWKRYLLPTASLNSSDTISCQQAGDCDSKTLCSANYPDRILLTSSVEANGCRVLCSFFGSSSDKYRDFSDSTEDIVHYLSDHTPCGNNTFCLKGKCVNPNNLPGRAELKIIEGYFPDQDLFSFTDAYIKVQAFTTYKTDSWTNLGSTIVVEDREWPEFNAIFTSPISYKNGYFDLFAWDRDSSPDDFITRIKIPFDACPDNQKCRTSGSRNFIDYSLMWYPESYPERLEKH